MKKGNKETRNKETTKLPMSKGTKTAFTIYSILVVAAIFGVTTVLATSNDPIKVVNNLSDFIFGLIRALGIILLGFGIVQVGLSLKSHDASQRANGFMTLAGGVVIACAKEILDLILK